jgi:hypothetical protein
MNMQSMHNKLMDRFFKKVDGVVWDLMTGQVGIQGPDGISTLEGEGDDAQVNLNMLDQFGMPVPAFAQSTAIDSVKVGDLIYVNGKPKGWVIQIKEKPATMAAAAEGGEPVEAKPASKKFVVMSPGGSSGTWTPPKVAMFGLDSGVMVLKSLGEMLPGGEAGLSGMQGMMMPMMMMGGDMDMDSIMPMMLMSQMGNMGGGAVGSNNMLQTMLMMKMMGGGGGMGKMFSGKGGKSFFDNDDD